MAIKKPHANGAWPGSGVCHQPGLFCT